MKEAKVGVEIGEVENTWTSWGTSISSRFKEFIICEKFN